MENNLITIGIRAAPKSVVFAIFDTDTSTIHTVEKIVIPAAFEPPDALKYVRSNLLDILREFRVEKAGLRTTESFAAGTNINRIMFEAVILEAFASSNLKAYYIGQVSSIAAKIGIERNQFKLMIANTQTPDIENWARMSKEEREAILCAKGAEHA